jgi:hypothetical protein
MEYLVSLVSPASATHRVGFEDVIAMRGRAGAGAGALIINTLPAAAQHCVIAGTVDCGDEETRINALVRAGAASNTAVLIYGEHACDPAPETKRAQLRGLGFVDVMVYVGGLFEYLLLQDIYGADAFPTRGRETDLLSRRPRPRPAR